ncbi:MAG: alpha/beta hydrolase [Pseudomonadota bacterium]
MARAPVFPKTSHAADLLGLSRLTIGAVSGVADLVEAVHLNILGQVPVPVVIKPLARATSLVYSGVRGVTGLVGGGLDRALRQLQPLLGDQSGWAGRESLLAAVNGVLGDHLARTANPLAIPMSLRRNGASLALDDIGDDVNGRILVLAHGLCMNDLQWRREGHDHGAALQAERGYTPLYLHYNSGRHISENGRDFAEKLEALLAAWPVPVEELVIVGHSMGGLVTRSACHYGELAGHGWLRHLSKAVFLGSPHHGAPLERGGNWINVVTDMTSYTAPFSRLAKLRSAGITDLRHGSLLDSDWEEQDRFAHGAALPQSVPLPASVACYTVAATIGEQPDDISNCVAGDGLVPLASALGRHDDRQRSLTFPTANRAVVYGTNHMELLNSPVVYQQLLEWL